MKKSTHYCDRHPTDPCVARAMVGNEPRCMCDYCFNWWKDWRRCVNSELTQAVIHIQMPVKP